MEPDGIEPLAATPLDKGYRVTAGNGEQAPNLSHTLSNVSYKTNCLAMRPYSTSKVERNQFALYATILRISVFTTNLPSGRPPTLSPCFKCRQGRVPYTHYFESLKTKNPRVFNPGVLGS